MENLKDTAQLEAKAGKGIKQQQLVLLLPQQSSNSMELDRKSRHMHHFHQQTAAQDAYRDEFYAFPS